MNRHRAGLRWLPLALAAALFAGACSSSASDSEPTAAASEDAQGGAVDASPGGAGGSIDPGALASPGGGDGQGGSADAGGDGGDGQGGSADGETELNAPPPMDFPYKTPVQVEAVLDPTCVERGGRVIIEVSTRKPEAAVIYNAVYSDGYGGSGPPFGKGYGGNDKGYTSDDGTYESSWVVSLDAPFGRARVDVIVGVADESDGKWGYDGPHFAVADEDGNCPEKWLRSEESDPN